MATHDELLTRRGHLSELTLLRYLDGELDPRDQRLVLEHLDACADCAQALSSLRDFGPDGSHALALASARPGAAGAASPGARRPVGPWRRVAAWGGAAATASPGAAAAALVAWPTREPGPSSADPYAWRGDPSAPPEGDRVKGQQALRLEVFVHDGQRARQALDGERVYPGDRLGFKLYTWRPGYVWIVGVDERQQVYAGYPQDEAAPGVHLASEPMGRRLDVGLRLDDVLGRERLIALLCDRAQTFASARALALADDAAAQSSGCARHHVTLYKQARP